MPQVGHERVSVKPLTPYRRVHWPPTCCCSACLRVSKAMASGVVCYGSASNCARVSPRGSSAGWSIALASITSWSRSPCQPSRTLPSHAPGRTVRAKAVGGEARQAGTNVPPALQGRGEGGAGLGGLVAAEVEVEFKLALACRAAEQGDHAARAVAVERREGPAQDLDALGAGQVEVGDLARAVGHGGRDAIGVETQAPHAEARARTEAARADLQVLRVVVAVVDGEAGHALQRFREVHHQAACAYLLGVHHGDGVGRVEDTGLDARAGHDHGFELLGLAGWSLRRARAREPQEGDRQGKARSGGQAHSVWRMSHIGACAYSRYPGHVERFRAASAPNGLAECGWQAVQGGSNL